MTSSTNSCAARSLDINRALSTELQATELGRPRHDATALRCIAIMRLELAVGAAYDRIDQLWLAEHSSLSSANVIAGP